MHSSLSKSKAPFNIKEISEINKEKASDAKEKWMSLGGNLHH